MSNPSDLAAQVISCISEYAVCSEAAIKPELDLFTDLGFDSLDAIELMIELEAEFSIDLSSATGEDPVWHTVQDVIDTVQGLVEGA